MQISKTKEKKKIPSRRPRKNSVRKYFGSRQNGSGKRSGSASAGPGVGLSVLTSMLKPRYMLDAALQTGEDLSNGIVSIIDTKEKKLQAIEDLYHILKAQPKYKHLNDDKWTIDTDPMEIIKWLLRKLGALAEGKDWLIDTYKHRGKTRFRYVVTEQYSGHQMKKVAVHLPIDFLPFLAKKDKPMHDLIVDVLALVSRENSVPLWDEDGDYSEVLESWMNEPSVIKNYLLDDQLKMYRTGIARDYLDLIKRRREVVTINRLQKDLQAYSASSYRKEVLVWWIRYGLKVASFKKCITENCYIPNYIDGTPVTPFRNYKIVWSIHEIDILHLKAEHKINKDSKEFGDFDPMNFCYAGPGQKIPKLGFDRYPIYLSWFFFRAYRHFLGSYRQYYYKDLLDDPSRTPGETLLQIFEFDELKNINKKG